MFLYGLQLQFHLMMCCIIQGNIVCYTTNTDERVCIGDDLTENTGIGLTWSLWFLYCAADAFDLQLFLSSELLFFCFVFFQPLHQELYNMHPTTFFVPSFLNAITENKEESFRSIISQPVEGVFTFEMLQPRFCEMMLAEVSSTVHVLCHDMSIHLFSLAFTFSYQVSIA